MQCFWRFNEVRLVFLGKSTEIQSLVQTALPCSAQSFRVPPRTLLLLERANNLGSSPKRGERMKDCGMFCRKSVVKVTSLAELDMSRNLSHEHVSPSCGSPCFRAPISSLSGQRRSHPIQLADIERTAKMLSSSKNTHLGLTTHLAKSRLL